VSAQLWTVAVEQATRWRCHRTVAGPTARPR